MSPPAISFDNFELPFTSSETSCDADEEESDSTDIGSFEDQIPKNAVFVGTNDSEVDNWTSWKIEDHYYVIPWEGSEFDWALFRISWDDNWGRYDWSTDARIKGVADPREAARQMVRGLFAQWGIDLSEADRRADREFLESI